MVGTPALTRYEHETDCKKENGGHHEPQSVMRRTNCWGTKKSVMLHVVAVNDADGIPNVVVSMSDEDVADFIDAGTSCRWKQKQDQFQCYVEGKRYQRSKTT